MTGLLTVAVVGQKVQRLVGRRRRVTPDE